MRKEREKRRERETKEKIKDKKKRDKKLSKQQHTFVVFVVEENSNARVFFFSFIREEELTCITECIDTWF